MPLFTTVEPVCVSRGQVGDNLEKNAGRALSEIILQLSNLSLRGGQLMEELLEEISRLNKRYNSIKNRIDSMNVELKAYSQTSVVIRNKRKKPSLYKPVFMRDTFPQSLRDQYDRCEPPPSFKAIFGDIPFAQGDCEPQERIRFYSNINYFKDSWCEQKKQMKIKKRTTRNKLLKLQTTEISDVFQKDDKFYPAPIHQVKPRITETPEKSQPLLTESPIKQQFMPQSGIPIEPDTSNQALNEYPSFCTNCYQDSEPDTTSELSREQGSYKEDSSSIYEIFAPAEVVSNTSSPELDRASTSDTGQFSQCNQNRAMEPIPTISHSNSIESIQPPQSETLVGRKIFPLKERSSVPRRESAVKDLLRSFVLERRRFIKLESSSGTSDYSEESSTDSDDSPSDSQD